MVAGSSSREWRALAHLWRSRRPQGAWLAIIACSIAAGGAADASTSDYRIAPAPAWVQVIPAPIPAPVQVSTTDPHVAYGVRYGLVDDQIRSTAHEKARYHHGIRQAVTQKGVDEISHLEIDVDPSYETLTLHQLDLVRDGERVSRLTGARITVLQRERDLESRIYDGRKSVDIALPDVRTGDTIEFAWTLAGSNPVFGAHRFGHVGLQWDVPVDHVFRRLSVADGLPVRITTLNGAGAPVEGDSGGIRSWTWDLRDVPALHLEAETPTSHDPRAQAQWTDFASWDEVARWARPLYATSAPGPALQAEIDRIAASTREPEARAIAALRWVQKEVRYLGIEMGPGSHAPSVPAVVLARRFGDCKDKARLTVTMLRALGLDASVALVDTHRRQAIGADAPTPASFDHVIVLLHLNGLDYWLDPTRPPQGGTLATIHQPDFGLALPLDDRGPAALRPMGEATPAGDVRDVTMTIDASAGTGKPASLVIRTVHHRLAADWMRDRLGDGEREELQRRYLNFYADDYPGIQVAAPMKVEDDFDANELVVTESYRIDRFWSPDKRHGGQVASIAVPELDSALRAPKEAIRRMPLAIGSPQTLRVDVDVRLPEAWPSRKEHSEVRNPAFKLVEAARFDGVRFTENYVLERTRREVAPGDVAAYAADLGRARKMLGYEIRTTPPGSQAADKGTIAAWAFAGVMLAIMLASTFWAKRHGVAAGAAAMPTPPTLPGAEDEPVTVPQPVAGEDAPSSRRPTVPVRRPFLWLATTVVVAAMATFAYGLVMASHPPRPMDWRFIRYFPILGMTGFWCLRQLWQGRGGREVTPPGRWMRAGFGLGLLAFGIGCVIEPDPSFVDIAIAAYAAFQGIRILVRSRIDPAMATARMPDGK